jgi:hypothetical protein
LKSDPALGDTLSELKAQRAVRAAVWQSNEPDAAAADRLMWRVRGAILQEKQQENVPQRTRFWSQWRISSVGSAAAACLVLGFMFGRMGQSHHPAVNPGMNPGLNPGVSSGMNQIVSTDGTGGIARVDNPSVAPDPGPAVNPVTTAGVDVAMYDEYKRKVGVQHFANPEEAKQFLLDLHGTHIEPSSPAVPGPSRVAADEHPQVPF